MVIRRSKTNFNFAPFHRLITRKPMMNKNLLLAALFPIIATVASAQPMVWDGVLTDTSDRTLYTFDKDTAGRSKCR